MADVERALRNKPLDKDLLIAATTLVVAPILGFGLSAAGVPDVVLQHSVPAAITVVAVLLLRRQERRLAAKQLNEVASGQASVSPLVIVLTLVAFILLLETITGAILGSLVGSAVMVVGGAAADIPYAVADTVPGYTLVLLLFWMVPIGFFASPRIGRRATFWILVAIVVSRILRLALLVALSRNQDWLSVGFAYLSLELLAVQPLLMLLPAWIGHRIARSRYSAFLLLQSFRKLSADDRQAVLGLLTEPKTGSSREGGAG